MKWGAVSLESCSACSHSTELLKVGHGFSWKKGLYWRFVFIYLYLSHLFDTLVAASGWDFIKKHSAKSRLYWSRVPWFIWDCALLPLPAISYPFAFNYIWFFIFLNIFFSPLSPLPRISCLYQRAEFLLGFKKHKIINWYIEFSTGYGKLWFLLFSL